MMNIYFVWGTDRRSAKTHVEVFQGYNLEDVITGFPHTKHSCTSSRGPVELQQTKRPQSINYTSASTTKWIPPRRQIPTWLSRPEGPAKVI